MSDPGSDPGAAGPGTAAPGAVASAVGAALTAGVRDVAGAAAGGTRPRRPGRLEPVVISALYATREAVEAAMRRLYDAGVPRDLIDVVVSREAAERFYPGRTRGPGREVFQYAGIGGLAGLIAAVALSLAIVAWPGMQPPGTTAIVQLLGPNIGAVGGAMVGAIYGFFRRRRPNRRYARTAEAASAILLLVRTRGAAEVPALRDILAASGGRDVDVA